MSCIKNKFKVSVIVFFSTLFLFSAIFVDKANAQTTYEHFVTNMYQSILCRAPDPTGLKYWSGSLQSGKITGADFVKYFVNCPEFTNKGLSNGDYVTILYRAILSRKPDDSGQAFWVGRLNYGYTRNYVLAGFVNSKEFQDMCTQNGIKPGSIALTEPADTHIDLINYLNGVYGKSLNRNPSSDEIKSYVTKLANKQMTGAELAESIVLGAEFQNFNVSNDSYVEIIYSDFYGRTPNSDELSSLLKKMQNGYTRKRILSDLLSSQEFKNLMQKYSIVPGSIKLTDPVDLSPDLVCFVKRLYNLTLSREPDAGGLSYYVSKLYHKSMTGAEILHNFIFSAEFVSRKVNANQYLEILYRATLNREPDSGGLSWYLTQLMNGYSRLYVLSCFINSTEFGSYVAAYRIDKGQIALRPDDKPYNGIVYGYTHYLVNDGIEISVKSQPSKNASTIAKIADKQRVVIANRTMGYYLVRYISSTGNILIEGYISDDYMDVINDDLENDYSGVISERYESNGNPGAISSGTGDAGGKSYGAWQLSSAQGSLNSFLQWLKGQQSGFYNTLNSAYIADSNTYGTNFDKAWQQIAGAHYDEFYSLQHEYIKLSYYDSLINKLVKSTLSNLAGFDKLLTSFSVRNVLWSTAVQHGVSGAYTLINRLTIDVNDKLKFINDVYAERSKVDIYFPKCSPDVQQGVINRFIKEKNDADRIYEYEIENFN